MTRIIIVDDHPIVRQGLRQTIEREEDLEICAEYDSAEQALSQIAGVSPDLAVVDISLGGTSGIELIKQMRAIGCAFPVLVLSVHDDVTYAERALKAGAQGYILKQVAPEFIIAGIRKILEGNVYVCDRMATKLLSRFVLSQPGTPPKDSPIAALSDRELEVFELIGRGVGSREIAGRLGVSLSTIETHRANIKAKINVSTAAELAKAAATWVLGGT
jgi:DNA-binding NarL/FixJ family response regulator